jgi:hypothetical protein
MFPIPAILGNRDAPHAAHAVSLTRKTQYERSSPLWMDHPTTTSPNREVHAAIHDVRFTSILLKKSEIEVPRKSCFRADSGVSTGSCRSKA